MTQNILVVENDNAVRQLIASTLVSAGYECRQVDDVEALAVVDSGAELELVLSSLAFPKLDALSLMARIRSKHSDTPTIVMAEIADVKTARRAVGNGAYDYLMKPIDADDLLSAVQRAIEHRRLKLERRTYQHELETLVTARTEQVRGALVNLERAYDITLDVLGSALNLKQADSGGHSKRVTAYAIAIARSMAVPVDEIRVIARGAFLHDIGKMAVPDSILRKPGALDREETAIMREHCSRGYEMIKDIPFLAEAAQIIYCHHENYDGSGYPRALNGAKIPLGALITAVANTLDAITSDQPYRSQRPLSVAREEIQRGAGRQFDPKVVKIFLGMPENVWSDLRKGLRPRGDSIN